MLTGDAKRAYQREYMRRKRAGEPTRKPKLPEQPTKPEKPWEPTKSMIWDVRRWFSLKVNDHCLRGIGRDVVHDLDPNNADGSVNEAAWIEAMRRYKTLRREQRVERERKQAERDKPKPKRCSFCYEPASAERILIGDSDNSFRLICETCVEQASKVVAETRAASGRSGGGGRA